MTHQELKLRFVSMGIAGPPFPQRNGGREGIRVLGIDGEMRIGEVHSPSPSPLAIDVEYSLTQGC